MGHAVPASRRRFVRVEPLEARTLMSTVPNDPEYNVDLRFTNMNASAAWDITTGTRTGDPTVDPVIVVLDTGVDIAHEDLAANIFTNPFEIDGDGVDNDNNGFIDDAHGWDFMENDNDVDDVQGHGSHVAGIIGAVGNNGLGITGVAWNTTLLPIKVLGDEGFGTREAIINGIRYATQLKKQGINIVAINASLSGTGYFIFDQAYERAVREAGDAGILLVVASGNDDDNNDSGFTFPAKFSLSEPSVITVGATGSDDNPATFTNTGTASVQVAAPGVNIQSIQSGGGYTLKSGTSMASPEVAGIIALLASANPRASMAELKKAVLESVDVLPSLDGPNSLPLLVSTGGRVNAYRALKAILNHEIKTDSSTSGNWKGNYGVEGYDIPNDATALPLGAVYTVTGAEIGTAKVGTKPSALESVTSTEKVSTFYKADQLIDINLHIVDGLTHRVSLYFAQYSGASRTQLIEVFDPSTGAIISSETVSDFAKGKYVTFDITGNVNIRVSKLKGADVILSALFIDPTSVGSAGFVGTDTTTSGNWRDKYDANGAVIVGRTDFPTNEVVGTVTGATTETITSSSTKKGALVLEGEAKKGSVGYYTTDTTATIDLNFTDDASKHEVTVYAVDFDKKKRSQRIELLDASGNMLDQREISNFTTGVYLTWNVTGDVKIRFTRLQGPDAVISAIFIDEQIGNSGHFIGQDEKTGGAWKGFYGLDEQFIIGDRDDVNFFPAKEFDLPQTGGLIHVVSAATRKKSAVTKYAHATDRIAAQLETRNQMEITLDLVDTGNPQRVSFYAVDYENKRRAQRLDIFDGDGNLISSTDMVTFTNGAYATFDLSGTVTARITNLENNANRAVLSAVFYG